LNTKGDLFSLKFKKKGGRKEMATCQQSGVNIDAGNLFAQMIKERVKKAWPKTAENIGRFAGGLAIPEGAKSFEASTDGRGTAAILDALCGRWDALAYGATAMSLVDTYISGARPAALLDTLQVARLESEKHIAIIENLIKACQYCGCELIGGETAELPDMFPYSWMVDLDTTVIGFSDANLIYAPVRPGQIVYGWPSNGPASNGFSLLRKVFGLKIRDTAWQRLLHNFGFGSSIARVRERLAEYVPELGETLAAALLRPTPIWIKAIEYQRQHGVVFSGHAHITGGGMVENISRILPPDFAVEIYCNTWRRPPIFALAQEIGKIDDAEMNRVFNQGIMVVSIVAKGEIDDIEASDIGCVIKRKDGEPQVQFCGRYQD